MVVTLQSAGFAVTAQELQTAEAWARSRASLGNAQRDRSSFIDRFETILARCGSGFASKGSRAVLAHIVKGMQQNGIEIKEWSVPHNTFESVEVQKPKSAAPIPPISIDTPERKS